MDVAFSRYRRFVVGFALGFVAGCYGNTVPNHEDKLTPPYHAATSDSSPDAGDPGSPATAYDSGTTYPTVQLDSGTDPVPELDESDRPPPEAADGGEAPDALPMPQQDGGAQSCSGGTAHIVDPTTGHCYRYFRADLSFLDAEAACAHHAPGGHLATITSTASNTVVTALVNGHESWIGLWAPQGTFVWIDHTPLTYTHWARNEPGSLDGHHCVSIDPGVNGWKNAHCPDTKDFVCEAP